MKYHINTYELYRSGKKLKFTVRIRVTMKDDVDINVLKKSINVAIKRYPYFCKEIFIDKDGAYNLKDNNREIVVIETRDKLPPLASKEVNKHLFYVDAKDRDINFNISHSLAGGKGFTPLIETCLYQYVVDKYKVDIDAPNIRKHDSELLENEDIDIDETRFIKENTLKLKKRPVGYVTVLEYLNYLLNPFSSSGQYYILSFDSKDIIKYAKDNDSSVISTFIVLIYKALCRVLPFYAKTISCGLAHNPTEEYGYINNHSNILTHPRVSFKRNMSKYDNEKLGTLARSQIFLQTDPDYSCLELSKHFNGFLNLDKKKSYLSKKIYANLKCSNLSDGGEGTFLVNYTGKRDFGELAKYIESYVFIVDGHIMSEITSMSDKLFLAYIQASKNEKYIKAICKELEENNIPYTIKGPFERNNVEVKLPKPRKRKNKV